MQPSIFTQIINGEIPCHKVHESDKAFALMDIYPIQPGQVLVVPKKQVGFVWDLESEDYQEVMKVVQQVGRQIRKAFPDKKRVGVIIEGLDVVDHAHVKVFPFDTHEELCHVPDRNLEPDHEALATMAKTLAF